MTILIALDNVQDVGVILLLQEHLADMQATSPPESIHALDIDSLRAPDITFWCAREDGTALGCIALKEHSAQEAEIKSMRTTVDSRGKGVGSALLTHLLNAAKARGYRKLSLETGSQDFFQPARNLYAKFGFECCEPFADYTDDPNSVFMSRNL